MVMVQALKRVFGGITKKVSNLCDGMCRHRQEAAQQRLEHC